MDLEHFIMFLFGPSKADFLYVEFSEVQCGSAMFFAVSLMDLNQRGLQRPVSVWATQSDQGSCC